MRPSELSGWNRFRTELAREISGQRLRHEDSGCIETAPGISLFRMSVLPSRQASSGMQ